MNPKHDKELVDDNWDGVKHEEHKMMDAKLTTSKSRWSWTFSDACTDDEWAEIFGKAK